MNQKIESSDRVDESVVSKMSTEIDERIQEAVSEKAEMEKHATICIGAMGHDTGMSIVDRGVKIAKIEGKIEAMVSIRAMIRSIGGQI